MFDQQKEIGYSYAMPYGLSLTLPAVIGTNPCEICIRRCEKQYERDEATCTLLGHGLAHDACILSAQRKAQMCVEECIIEYDSECDEYLGGGGGGGGMGPCHYEVETGRCVPYR